MLSEKVILLDVQLFSAAKTHELKQVDQEVLDFGWIGGVLRMDW